MTTESERAKGNPARHGSWGLACEWGWAQWQVVLQPGGMVCGRGSLVPPHGGTESSAMVTRCILRYNRHHDGI
jgi:hypothetical protein